MTKEEKARLYANNSQFKSNFPHDWNSAYAGFISGYEAAEKEVHERAVEILRSINLADIDAPIFTHAKQFREHFDFIKKEITKLFIERYDNE